MAGLSSGEKESIRKLIVDFFSFAGVPTTSWDGTVNECVAGVFTTMYRETVKCSKAMAFVPEPPMGPASYLWLATQLGGGAFKRIQGKLSQTCARQVINLYRSDLQMASMGVSSLRFAKWA
ncbi:hypothetical protein WKW79_24975 [Variovorax robiniae]|uniref:Uncharacterized protein n=1 Tax=Variovorax robiniae TaxID=1836199 RepID=A0ABU8XDD6_9BURK